MGRRSLNRRARPCAGHPRSAPRCMEGVGGRDTPGLYLGTTWRVDDPGAAMTIHGAADAVGRIPVQIEKASATKAGANAAMRNAARIRPSPPNSLEPNTPNDSGPSHRIAEPASASLG